MSEKLNYKEDINQDTTEIDINPKYADCCCMDEEDDCEHCKKLRDEV